MPNNTYESHPLNTLKGRAQMYRQRDAMFIWIACPSLEPFI